MTKPKLALSTLTHISFQSIPLQARVYHSKHHICSLIEMYEVEKRRLCVCGI